MSIFQEDLPWWPQSLSHHPLKNLSRAFTSNWHFHICIIMCVFVCLWPYNLSSMRAGCHLLSLCYSTWDISWHVELLSKRLGVNPTPGGGRPETPTLLIPSLVATWPPQLTAHTPPGLPNTCRFRLHSVKRCPAFCHKSTTVLLFKTKLKHSNERSRLILYTHFFNTWLKFSFLTFKSWFIMNKAKSHSRASSILSLPAHPHSPGRACGPPRSTELEQRCGERSWGIRRRCCSPPSGMGSERVCQAGCQCWETENCSPWRR